MSAHLETFREHTFSSEEQLPKDVECGFTAYLECGILACGIQPSASSLIVSEAVRPVRIAVIRAPIFDCLPIDDALPCLCQQTKPKAFAYIWPFKKNRCASVGHIINRIDQKQEAS